MSNNNNVQNYAVDSGAIRQKSEAFRKEIRSERLNMQFASKRKMIFREQAASLLNQATVKEFPKLNSWEEVRSELEAAFMPNYQGIQHFIKQHLNELLPSDVQKLLLASVQRSQLLTCEEGMVLLATITNIRTKEAPILQPAIIRPIVDTLIRANLVLCQIDGQQVWKLHYFQTLCWVLFCLATVCQNSLDEVFLTFKQHIHVFESQSASDQISLELVSLLAALSTTPSLHPSHAFIKHALIQSSNPSLSKDVKLMGMLVVLLDNFVRYNFGQAGQRFEDTKGLEMGHLYVGFIFDRLQDWKFPKNHKLSLIQLLTTLAKSLPDDPLIKMFECKQSLQLMELIFYKAEFDEWKSKKASLICLSECLCRVEMLPILTRLIQPSAIAHICWNSLLLPDIQVQEAVLCAMFSLCHFMFEVYQREFRKFNFVPVIKQYEAQQTKSDNQQEREKLTFILHQVHDKLRRQHSLQTNTHQDIEI